MCTLVTYTSFSRVPTRWISYHNVWFATVRNPGGSQTHLLNALSIMFRDKPFVNGSARFLAIFT